MHRPPGHDPAPDPVLIRKALAAVRDGRLPEAERHFLRLVRDCPRRIELHLSLAAILRDRERFVEALDRLRQALALDPQRTDIRLQMGAVQFQLGRTDDAIVTYQDAAARSPEVAESHDVLAVALWHAGRLDEAGASFTRYTELCPTDAQGHMNLGAVLHAQGLLEPSISAYFRVLALAPTHADAHENLGKALARLHVDGQVGQAEHMARDWRRRFPEDAWAQHFGAAVSGDDVPDRASDAFLRAEFDGCADTFEQHLISLGYCAPRLLAEAVARALPPAHAALDVLDLGCGPGTAGPFLRAQARRLTGVDLAGRMLDRARAGGSYDALEIGEIGEFLRVHPRQFDLIFATDVLCYVGRLDRLLESAAGALRPGGTLAFTVETESGAVPFRLRPSGRYRHTPDYLRQVVAAGGLALLDLFQGPGRSEGAEHQECTYLVARKTAPTA